MGGHFQEPEEDYSMFVFNKFVMDVKWKQLDTS